MSRILVAMTAIAAFLISSAASADTIPLPPDLLALYPTTSTITGVAVSTSFPDGASISASSTTQALSWSGMAGSAQAAVASWSGFAPSVSATASGSAHAGPNEGAIGVANGQSTYKYFFRVYDPSVAFSFVPLRFDFALYASVTGVSASEAANVRAQAAASIFLPGKYFGLGDTVTCSGGECAEDQGGTAGPNNWSFDYFQTNGMYSIFLVAYALADCRAGSDPAGSACSATASALVDPYITVDPAWLSTHPGAQLQIGTFDQAPVPEPSTLLLCVSALAGAAGAARRRLRCWIAHRSL